jgi:sulfoxide reductase heme-binding subunit YedZ
LLLLTAAVVLGVAGPLRARPRVLLAGLHRSIPLLAIAFVTAHVLTTVADGYAPIGVKDAILPFLSPYRPVWLGLGTVAFDLLLALVATSLLRARIGLRGWRAVHWLAYLSWPVAAMHGLGTGTDAKAGWFVLLTVVCTLAVAGAVVLRLLLTPGLDGGRRLAALGAVPAVLLVLLVWAKTGPLQHGWAQRAGTPTSLIPAASRTVSTATTGGGTTVRRPVPATPLPYSATLSGALTQAQPNSSGIATVEITARTSGPVAGRLRATLYGVPLDNGGLSMQSSDVAYATAGSPAAYRGQVVALAGPHITAVVANAAGRHLRLDLDLRISPSSGAVGGTLHVHHSGRGAA